MKTLMVMRHAKSSWDDPQLDDHDRPLNARGLRDAPRMAAWLLEQDCCPDSITCSTALRAVTTARLVADGLEAEIPFQTTADLYHANLEAWQHVIRNLPAESIRALCVGHNPGIEMLFHAVTGASERFPTATICVLELSIDDWEAFEPQKSLVTWELWRPKQLPPGIGGRSN